MTPPVSVRPALNEGDLARFVRVPRTVFRDVDNWLPPPESAELALLQRGKNPFFEHAEVALYLAERGNDVVGRIAVFVDERTDSDIGFFGFFDVIDDVEVGRALLWAASDWCRSRGRARLRGPVDFWAVLSAGAMTDGFEQPNYAGLRHGMPYYAAHLAAADFQPFADLAVWEYGRRPLPLPARAIADAVWATESLTCENFRPQSTEDWETVASLYAAAYVDHEWYFPMDVEELRLIAGGEVDPTLSFIARYQGKPAAMAIALRNEAQTALRVGGMMPPEAVQRVWRTTNRPKSWRQWLFAVAPPFRGRALGGLGTALYVRVRDAADAAGYQCGETAWTASVAERLRHGLNVLGATQYKSYRVFERPL